MNLHDVITGRQVVSLARDPYSKEIDTSHSLRLVLHDLDTDEMFLLAVEPDSVVMPEENLLFYSLQALETTLPVPEHLYDVATRLEPEVAVGETPSFFNC